MHKRSFFLDDTKEVFHYLDDTLRRKKNTAHHKRSGQIKKEYKREKYCRFKETINKVVNFLNFGIKCGCGRCTWRWQLLLPSKVKVIHFINITLRNALLAALHFWTVIFQYSIASDINRYTGH